MRHSRLPHVRAPLRGATCRIARLRTHLRRVQRPRGSTRQCTLATPAAICLAVGFVAVLLGGCDLPLLSGRASNSAHPTATAIPTLAPNKGDAGATPFVSLSNSDVHCSQVSGLTSAQTASAGTTFADVLFPAQSVSTTASVPTKLYTFQLVTACSEGAGEESILAFFAARMSASGWVTSRTFPYDGDPTHACGDPYCWRKADKSVRYVSLERMSSSTTLTVYLLRLATAPAPQATLSLRSASGLARGGRSLTVSASCHAGEQMLGGGYSISSSDHSYTASASYPSGSTTWTVSATATGSSTLELQAYIGCAQTNYSLGVQIISVPFDMSAGAPQITTVSCPSGVVVSGGAQITSSGGVLAESGPSDDGKAWNAVGAVGTNGAKGTAYAVCATRSLDVTPSTKRSFPIESGNDTQASLACPDGQWLTSGGFTNSDPSGDGKNVFALDGPTADYSRWFIQGHNLDASSAHGATIWVTCVRPDPQF